MEFEHLQAAADAVSRSADVWEGFSAQDAKVCIEAYFAARGAAANGAIVGALASLAAAISLLERGGKKAAPSDKMFKQMLSDYRKSLEEARAALTAAPKPCLHVRMNVNRCEDCGAEFDFI